jgi:hypothetical protein
VVYHAYRALSLELLAHNRRDFARLIVASGDHQRRFTVLECVEVLFDRFFAQSYAPE